MLSEEQFEVARKKLEEVHKKPCPSCDGSHFAVVGLFDAVPFGMTGVWDAGPTVPVLLVQCESCGFLLHFSATAFGLADPAEPHEVEP